MSRTIILVILCTASAVGCGGKQAARTATPTARPVPAATAATAAQPVTPTLGMSEDLAQQCGLRFGDVGAAPKFEYDRDELPPADRDVLAQVATCLTSGPLKGRAVRLVGRADPRGTTEYNLGLGTRRASSVEQYLQRLGVARQQLAATTRGDIDAAGHDEDGWRTDRRVDLELVN